MREILFRGKRIDNGEWVCSRSILTVLQDNKYLHFIPQQGEDFKAEPNEKNGRILTITKGNYYQVDYETIGQYTGLTDKNGKKIFEGDIVRSKSRNIPELMNYRGIVTFANGCFLLKNVITKIHRHFDMYQNECYVIGNIHDNPELLEVQNEK